MNAAFEGSVYFSERFRLAGRSDAVGRLVAAGVEVRWSRFILLGAVIAPLILVLAVLPLTL